MRFNKQIALGLILAVAGIQPSAYAAWFSGKKEQKTASNAAVVETSKSNANWEKKEGNAPSEQVEVPELPNLPKIPKVPNAKDSKALTGVPAIPAVPAATLPNQEPEIIKIQKQIHDIIKLNDTLKAQYSDQAAEIQKISEQAKIHQRILQDLEKTKSEIKTTSSDSLIVQEKVRQIRKETDANRKFLNTLQTNQTAAAPQHKTE